MTVTVKWRTDFDKVSKKGKWYLITVGDFVAEAYYDCRPSRKDHPVWTNGYETYEPDKVVAFANMPEPFRRGT